MADPSPPLDGSDTALAAQPLQELAQTLVDLVAARAALITLWHTERGQLLGPVEPASRRSIWRSWRPP